MDKLSVQLHAHKRARASLVRMSLRFFFFSLFRCVRGGVTQRTKGVILPSVSLNELWTVLCTGA